MSASASLLPPDAAGDAQPEVREKHLFAALSAELEQAVRLREKALAELTEIRRALDAKAADKFHSVREFQTRVDVFKGSFQDPAQLTLGRLFVQWLSRRRLALIILLAIVLALGAVVATGAVKNLLPPPPHPPRRKNPPAPRETPQRRAELIAQSFSRLRDW